MGRVAAPVIGKKSMKIVSVSNLCNGGHDEQFKPFISLSIAESMRTGEAVAIMINGSAPTGASRAQFRHARAEDSRTQLDL